MNCPECGILFIATVDDGIEDARPMGVEEPIVVECNSPYEEAEHADSTGKAYETECDGDTPLKQRQEADRVRVMEKRLTELTNQINKLIYNQQQSQIKSEYEKEQLLAALETSHEREITQERKISTAVADAKKTAATYEEECRQLKDEIKGLNKTLKQHEETIENFKRCNDKFVERLRKERIAFEQKYADQKQSEADAKDKIRYLVEMVEELMKSHWHAREAALDCHKFMEVAEDHAKAALDRVSKLEALKTVMAMSHAMLLQGTAIQARVEAHACKLSCIEVPQFDTGISCKATVDAVGGDVDKLDEDDELCEVCFERPKEVLFTSCGHALYCTTCVEWILNEGDRLCPKCRDPIKQQLRVLTQERSDQIHEYYVEIFQQALMEMYQMTVDTIKEESMLLQLEWTQGEKDAFDIVARIEEMWRATSNVDTFRDTMFPTDRHYWTELFLSHAEHCLMDGSSDPALCNDIPPFEASAVMSRTMAEQMTEYDHILHLYAQKDSFDKCHILELQRQMSEDIDTLNNKLDAAMRDRRLNAKVCECVEEMFDITSGNAKDTKDSRQAVNRAASDLGQLLSDKQPAARADKGVKKGKKKKKK